MMKLVRNDLNGYVDIETLGITDVFQWCDDVFMHAGTDEDGTICIVCLSAEKPWRGGMDAGTQVKLLDATLTIEII